ncbi:MAG TPA: glycosyl transferase [Gammaproteobacteria bacterium]|nr:glycosyl transferase [Gammaproteobacteria bacterium]
MPPFTLPAKASICLLRLSALGDVTHMLPVLHTLQKCHPQSRITWIIGKTEYQLVEGLAGVEFIIFDKSQGASGLARLRQQLRARQFDVLLHMQAALRASLISLFVPATHKVGFDRARAADFQWLFTHARIPARPRQHVLDGFFGFLEAIGIEERHMRWSPPIPDDAHAFARPLKPSSSRCLVINPSSSVRKNNFRNWRAERYAEIADYAAELHGMRVILTGGPSDAERDLSQHILRLSQGDHLDLTGKTSIKQMLAVLSMADLVIAPDTGPAHMATAVGTPVIGLYVTSNPYRTGPYNDLDAVVNAYPRAVDRAFGKSVDEITWGKRVRDPDAVDLITVDAVKHQLDHCVTQLNRD